MHASQVHAGSGIGWAYWSYNETFTVMASGRRPFGAADRQTPDRTLLETLLGGPSK